MGPKRNGKGTLALASTLVSVSAFAWSYAGNGVGGADVELGIALGLEVMSLA